MSYTNMRKRIQRKETRDSRMAIMPYLMVIIYFLYKTIDHSLLSRPISIYSVYSVTIQLNEITPLFLLFLNRLSRIYLWTEKSKLI